MPTRLTDPGMNLGRDKDIESYEQWINFKNHKLRMLKNLKNRKQYAFRDTKEFFNPNNEMTYNYGNVPPISNELENLIYQEYMESTSKNNTKNNVDVEQEKNDIDDMHSTNDIPEPMTDRPDLNNCIPCKPCKPCKA